MRGVNEPRASTILEEAVPGQRTNALARVQQLAWLVGWLVGWVGWLSVWWVGWLVRWLVG